MHSIGGRRGGAVGLYYLILRNASAYIPLNGFWLFNYFEAVLHPSYPGH